jgi:hypothetical protein
MMDSYNSYELAVHAVLRDWFSAIQDGSVHYRMPDPHYSRPRGKQPWTEEDLSRLVKVIDDYVWEQRNWAEGTHKTSYDQGPGYDRLPPAQRVAFAQDLERALATPAESQFTV